MLSHLSACSPHASMLEHRKRPTLRRGPSISDRAVSSEVTALCYLAARLRRLPEHEAALEDDRLCPAPAGRARGLISR